MEYQMNEINFLIFGAERELLHSTSLSLALGRPRLFLPTCLLLPTLEKFDIPSFETQSVGVFVSLRVPGRTVSRRGLLESFGELKKGLGSFEGESAGDIVSSWVKFRFKSHVENWFLEFWIFI